jgi:serine/threonine protein kinase
MLYHLVTGEVPFPGKTPVQVAEKKLTGFYTPASQRNPLVPPALDRILGKMMSLNPRDRYQTAEELITDLGQAKLDSSRVGLGLVKAATTAHPPTDHGGNDQTRTHVEPSAAVAVRVDPNVWYVRYRGPDGEWCKTRASTNDLLQRLRDRQLPAAAEAAHQVQGDYQPMSRIIEFREVVDKLRNSSSPTPSPFFGKPREKTPTPANSWLANLLVAIGILCLGIGTAVLYFKLLR